MSGFAEKPGALKETGRIVSLVGGGGKSTLMYFMAETCAAEGKRVLISTTTHIYRPQESYLAGTAEEVEALWQQGKFAVIGTPEPGTGKLSAPDPAMLKSLLPRADVTFLESDGAKGFPCKVPRSFEPVLHPESDEVMAVFGLSALGRPLREVCFCWKEAMALLGVEEDHILTVEDAAKIIATGSRKNVGRRRLRVVLNQCDDGVRRLSAEKLIARLAGLGICQVVLTAFTPEEREKYVKLSKGC